MVRQQVPVASRSSAGWFEPFVMRDLHDTSPKWYEPFLMRAFLDTSLSWYEPFLIQDFLDTSPKWCKPFITGPLTTRAILIGFKAFSKLFWDWISSLGKLVWHFGWVMTDANIKKIKNWIWFKFQTKRFGVFLATNFFGIGIRPNFTDFRNNSTAWLANQC